MDITRDQAINLDNNENWKAFTGELSKIILAESEDLLKVTDQADFIRLQERVKAFRFVIKFPSLLAEREEKESNIITSGD
jgi:hypothetical protein